jgi:hypothetical protein
MCSAVFVTGLDPDFAAENVGYFTAPYEVRHKLGKPVIDRAEKAVHVRLPNGVAGRRHVGRVELERLRPRNQRLEFDVLCAP